MLLKPSGWTNFGLLTKGLRGQSWVEKTAAQMGSLGIADREGPLNHHETVLVQRKRLEGEDDQEKAGGPQQDLLMKPLFPCYDISWMKFNQWQQIAKG